MKALGTHIVCELSGCNAAMLTDVDAVADMMERAALEANTTPIEKAFHRFQPQGVSGVVVIQEPHLSIHTWPETGYAARTSIRAATIPIRGGLRIRGQILGATNMRTTEVKRGIEAGRGQFTHVVTTDAEERSLERTA